MKNSNYKLKAKTTLRKQSKIREVLTKNNVGFYGMDYQTDRYFKTDDQEKIKIRKGDIENALIFYTPGIKSGSKFSESEIYPMAKHSYLEKIIVQTYELLVEVEKERETYFIDNIRFHMDNVELLGRFIEIEAHSEIDEITGKPKIPLRKLKKQCNYYKNLLKIEKSDLIKSSYSDMILKLKESIKK